MRWTVTAVNDGPNAIPGGVINDVLPAVVRNVGATVAGGPCSVSGRLLSCALPVVPAGGQAQIEIAGTLPAGSGGQPLANGIQIAPQSFVRGPFASVGTRPDAVALPAADVGVAKVATPAPAARNGRINYHLRATNHGPSTATNVVVRDTLPPKARFVRATKGRGCTARKRMVRCALGSIAANRSLELDVVARLHAGRRATSAANRATIDAAEPDPSDANNLDRISSALAPRLVLRKSADRQRAVVGETLNYTLRLSNRGPGAARKLVLCDRPSAGLKVRRAPGSRRSGRGRCWRIAKLPSGRSVRRRVVASVTAGHNKRRINRAAARVGIARAAVARATVRLRKSTPGPCPSVARASRRGPIARTAC